MKQIILIGIILILILGGCKGPEQPEAVEQAASCGDGVCDTGEDKCSCASDCGECSGDVEGKTCVELSCVDGSCQELIKENCCGNAKCEKGERTCEDCPACNDYDKCTLDYFDVDALSCVNEDIDPCCGNDVCEAGEDCDSCLLDCDCGVDLADYPDIFKGKSITIIVGAKASASDVTAGVDVSNGLSGYNIDTRLDNELTNIDERNVIVIGTPCDNEFSAELLPYERDCLEYIEEGTAVIRIFKTGSYSYAVMVAGNPISKTREAASYLRADSSKKLEGVEMVIS
ncbi:hypothetical protein KY332_04055 [Candidatus Woesearchaeota archaeon]|nr:hypothetical protein [Candidatus Woesearchaeota archaeon]